MFSEDLNSGWIADYCSIWIEFDFFGLYCLTAKKHLTELQKRLDTTERTMHLVMKQMEAVTKCLAKTLADDPSMSGDKSLAEITEGLVNLKESNV